MADKPPFDPVWGAFILLLVLVCSVLVGQVGVFAACAVLDRMCDRPLGGLTQIGLEVLTAVAILLGLGRPPSPPPGDKQD